MRTLSDIQAPKKTSGSFIVRHRARLGLLLFFLLLPAVLYVRLWDIRALPAIQFALDAVAYALVVLGMLIRLWSTLYIGGRKDSALQTAGPYSVTRNPLYAGSFLLGLGFAVITSNPLVLLLVLVYFAVQYRTTVRHEERTLAALFGAVFHDYMARVPRFIPNLALFDPTPPETVNLRSLTDELRHSLAFLALLLLWQAVTALQVAGVLGIWVVMK
ncbi:MAG TPA: isoprenylcysteine carboxylmethyltransferase family protein [Armatimonadota bacterium]|nr:isoprenylcysteine carboxylmethyltransferase family protein [Armatimonadota bacterium]HOS44562.1 isoprenylcysteine carboxylmethyltransferase family protein [Armatimonadota bacterium]